MKLVQISPSIVNDKIVGYYFLYKLEVPRGMGPKKKEDELLIYGVPIAHVESYCKSHHIKMEKYLNGKSQNAKKQ